MKKVKVTAIVGLFVMCFVVVPSWSHETLASEPQAGGILAK